MKMILTLCGLFLTVSAHALAPIVPTAIEVDFARASLQTQLQAKGLTLVADSIELRKSLDVPGNALELLSDGLGSILSHGQRLKNVDLDYVKFMAQDSAGKMSEGWTYVIVELQSSKSEGEGHLADLPQMNPNSINKLTQDPYTGAFATMSLQGHWFSTYKDAPSMDLHLQSKDQ